MRLGVGSGPPVVVAGRVLRDSHIVATPLIRTRLFDWAATDGNDPWWYATVRPYLRGCIRGRPDGALVQAKVTVSRYAVSGLIFGVILLAGGLVAEATGVLQSSSALIFLGVGLIASGLFFALLIWSAIPVSEVGHEYLLRWVDSVTQP